MQLKEDTFVGKKYKDFYEKKGYVPDIFNPYNNIEIENVVPTITTTSGSTTTSSTVLIKEATAKGYAEATNGDGVYQPSRAKAWRSSKRNDPNY